MVSRKQSLNTSGCLSESLISLGMWREDEVKPCVVSPEKVEFKNGLSVINEKRFCHSEKKQTNKP